MGLTLRVYRNGMDCTGGGDSAHADSICVVNVDGPFEPTDSHPAFKLIAGALPGTAILVPAAFPAPADGRWRGRRTKHDTLMGPCFGGNYAGTSDSRFDRAVEAITGARFYGALPIHDRFDTWEDHERLSR